MRRQALSMLAFWTVFVPLTLVGATPPDSPEPITAPPAGVESEPPGVASPAEPERPPAAPSMVGQLVTVWLKGGSHMKGTVVSLDDEQLVIELTEGAGTITLELEAVVRLAEGSHEASSAGTNDVLLGPHTMRARYYAALGRAALEERKPVLPTHRTRYFYGPSGMMLKKGEGYFSQKQLLFSAAAVGVTDKVSVLAGVVAPLLFFQPQETPGILAIKVGGEVAPEVHLAAASEIFFLDGSGFGLGGAVLTVGTPHTHASLMLAYPFAFDGGDIDPGSASLVALAGAMRLGERFAFVTENWLITGVSSQPFPVLSLGLRRFGRDHAFDFAFIVLPELSLDFAIPYFEWTFSWGQRAVEVSKDKPPVLAPPVTGQLGGARLSR